MNKARVFLSCGQCKGTDEPEIAHRIRDRLEGLGFECYIAVDDQSPLGLRESIFRQLELSDYFILIDFRREKLPDGTYRGSLFSNQELGIASFLQVPLLVLQEEGVKQLDGMIGAIQANAPTFYDRSMLPDRIADSVNEKLKSGGWSVATRNQLLLKAAEPPFVDALALYPDNRSYPRRHFHIAVQNCHHRKTALGCYAYIKSIHDLDRSSEIPTKTIEFKWAGTLLPSVRIAPSSCRLFDACHVRNDTPSEVEFNALTDSSDYQPGIPGVGNYRITYGVASENFAVAEAAFTMRVGKAFSDFSFYADSPQP